MIVAIVCVVGCSVGAISLNILALTNLYSSSLVLSMDSLDAEIGPSGFSTFQIF